MDDLEAIWSRLPAFLAVAQTEHLPSAARRTFVTASALSRTIRLLEEALGQPLFHRSGRRLELNEAGVKLRDAVGDAMSRLYGTLAELGGDPVAGPVRIGALGVLTDYFVLPAVLGLRATHPGLEPRLLLHRTAAANDGLALGRLDIAFTYEVLTDRRVHIERLGATGAGVYCGRGHPLFGVQARREDVLAHPFSVPQAGDSGLAMDGWPADLPREVGLQISTLATNLRVCLTGSYVTVLPDVAAREHVAAGRMWALPVVPLPPIPVYVAWRTGTSPRRAAREVVEAVRNLLERPSTADPSRLPP